MELYTVYGLSGVVILCGVMSVITGLYATDNKTRYQGLLLLVFTVLMAIILGVNVFAHMITALS